MDIQNKACFVEGLHSIDVIDTGVIITADCLHVSGSICESSAVDVEKRPISDQQEVA